MSDPDQAPRKPEPKGVGLWQTISSVAASFFGVQSRRNRERDFARGKATHFIAVGLLMTVVFVLLVVLAVRLALRSQGL
ncbi:MAG TPA: DUF2970 domain-containing protein [Solimonas sp.]|nr:DUF2970 domain-containing protein [Solimonas sp.]